MELTFLGTGSGKASLNREHSSILITEKNFNLLVDAGDGISKAFLRSKIDFNSIDGIIFSHLHPDHYTGLAALIVQMKMNKRVKSLTIYIYKDLIDVIKNFLIQSYLFPERMGFEVIYQPITEKKYFLISNEIKVLAEINSHLAESTKSKNYPYVNYSSLSFLFCVGKNQIHYTADVGGINDLFLFEDERTDILIAETTHISVDDILTATKKTNPSKIFLTHITDDEEDLLFSAHNNLPRNIKEKTIIASDGLIINL